MEVLRGGIPLFCMRNDIALIPKVVFPERNTCEEYKRIGFSFFGSSLLNSAVRISLLHCVYLLRGGLGLSCWHGAGTMIKSTKNKIKIVKK